MGITVREMLEANSFKDFKVIAGHKGLDRQIQGIAILDAPDGFEWTRGKELVVSSGYVFQQNPELFEKYIKSDMIRKISGLSIKIDRYLKNIPESIINAFNEYDIPLLAIPTEPSWMDIMNQLNILVMNKYIKQFKIGNIKPKSFSNINYKTRKINKILSQIDKEMDFPTMLYDLSNERPYYSSPEFSKLSNNLKLEDFWNPSFEFTQEVLCNNLKMVRYRFIDEKYDRPYSWITIPITVGDRIKAYFVVMEATELIDYFDQFALRIGFLLLQSLYEQILVAQSIQDIGFEKFIMDVIERNLLNNKVLLKRAAELGLDINANYYSIHVEQINQEINLSSYKEEFKTCIFNSISKIDGREALIDEKNCIFLFPVDDKISDKENLNLIKKAAKDLQNRLEKKIDDIQLVFGVSDIPESLTEIKRSYSRTKQAIKIGKILYPEDSYFTYSQLGVFAWMDIKEDELEIMLKDIELLIKNDDNNNLVETLKVYLECKMNYSLTAKHLFLHINTVRKRIEDINDLISFDLENPMNRLKLEILLKLVK